MKNLFLTILILTLFISCNKKYESIIISPDNYHESVDMVSEIMVHDIFSPPVASRVFAYPNIAAYEIMAQDSEAYSSLSGQLKELKDIPKASNQDLVNYQMASLVAHIDLSRRLIF